MILRCRLKRRDDPTRICGGLIGGAPDGAMQVGNVERVEDAAPGHYAMRCESCRRYVEIRPPLPMEGAA